MNISKIITKQLLNNLEAAMKPMILFMGTVAKDTETATLFIDENDGKIFWLLDMKSIPECTKLLEIGRWDINDGIVRSPEDNPYAEFETKYYYYSFGGWGMANTVTVSGKTKTRLRENVVEFLTIYFSKTIAKKLLNQ